MSNKQSFREWVHQELEPYFQGEYGTMDTMLEMFEDQLIDNILQRLPEKLIVPVLDSGNLSDYHEGFNDAIDDMRKEMGDE